MAIALLIGLPSIAWQIDHGWPTAEMLRNLHRRDSGPGSSLAFIPAQFIYINLALAPVWLGGLWWLMKDRCAEAPGSVWLEGFTTSQPLRLLRWSVPGPAVVVGLLATPFVLPVLPERSLKATGALPQPLSSRWAGRSWPTRSRPPIDRFPRGACTRRDPDRQLRRGAALELYGGERGLPPVFSGHNSYWIWGHPPERSGPVIAVRLPRNYLSRFFRNVRLAGRVRNSAGVDNEAHGAPVWICRGRRSSWSRLWSRVKHYD